MKFINLSSRLTAYIDAKFTIINYLNSVSFDLETRRKKESTCSLDETILASRHVF